MISELRVWCYRNQGTPVYGFDGELNLWRMFWVHPYNRSLVSRFRVWWFYE